MTSDSRIFLSDFWAETMVELRKRKMVDHTSEAMYRGPQGQFGGELEAELRSAVPVSFSIWTTLPKRKPKLSNPRGRSVNKGRHWEQFDD